MQLTLWERKFTRHFADKPCAVNGPKQCVNKWAKIVKDTQTYQFHITHGHVEIDNWPILQEHLLKVEEPIYFGSDSEEIDRAVTELENRRRKIRRINK